MTRGSEIQAVDGQPDGTIARPSLNSVIRFAARSQSKSSILGKLEGGRISTVADRC